MKENFGEVQSNEIKEQLMDMDKPTLTKLAKGLTGKAELPSKLQSLVEDEEKLAFLRKAILDVGKKRTQKFRIDTSE